VINTLASSGLDRLKSCYEWGRPPKERGEYGDALHSRVVGKSFKRIRNLGPGGNTQECIGKRRKRLEGKSILVVD